MSPKPALGIRFILDAKTLVGGLDAVKTSVSARSSIMVIRGVKITVSKSEIELVCTDMDQATRIVLPHKTPAKVAREGTAVVELRELLTMVKTFNGDLRFEQQDGYLAASQAETTVRFETMLAEDFPIINMEGKKPLTLDRDVFFGLWDHVRHAVSKDESRPVLSGVKLEIQNGVLSAAATDSYRLSFGSTAVSAKARELDLLLAGSALNTAQKLSKGSKTIKLAQGDRALILSFDNVSVFARKIDGEFPAWRKLLPEGDAEWIDLPKKEAETAVARIRKLATRNEPLRLSVGPTGVAILLLGHGFNTKARYEARFESESSLSDFTIGLNAEFFHEALNAFDSETIRLNTYGALRPVVIKHEDLGELLMPIRLAA